MPAKAKPIAERFWAKVKKVEGDGCWLWTACRTPEGYGRFGLQDGSVVLAHRMSFRFACGEPGRLCVLHKCDNPPCVRPDHLFLGTKTDNNADMRSKGRDNAARGTKHFRAKLNPEKVRDVRRSRAAGEHPKSIAKRIGYSQNAVGGEFRWREPENAKRCGVSMSRESFLRAICEQPDDDVVRLVFADWLDENGDPERAAFIRWHLNHRPTGFRPFDTGPNLEWHPLLPRRSRREGADRVEYLDGDGVVMALIYSRGFVSRIELPCAVFMEHAKALFSAHPITSVVLTDKQPDDSTPGFWWYDATPGDGAEYNDQPEYLPPELTGPRARQFATLDLAASWLSGRCIAYGRSLAGLREHSNSGSTPAEVA